jgi:hypothetical protein
LLNSTEEGREAFQKGSETEIQLEFDVRQYTLLVWVLQSASFNNIVQLIFAALNVEYLSIAARIFI